MPNNLKKEDELTHELFRGRTPAADSQQASAGTPNDAELDKSECPEPSDLRSVSEEANTRDESSQNPKNQVSRLEEASGD